MARAQKTVKPIGKPPIKPTPRERWVGPKVTPPAEKAGRFQPPVNTIPSYLMVIEPGVPLVDILPLVELVREHLARQPDELSFSLTHRRRKYQVTLTDEPEP